MNKSVIEENVAHAREALPYRIRLRGGTPPAPELIDRANAHLQHLVDAAEISRYDKLADAEKIIASGRFKAVIERDADRAAQRREPVVGYEYDQLRRIAENHLFGIPEEATAGRPIYGAVFNQNDRNASRYGQVKFIFRDTVRAVGTMTSGDSMNRLTRYPCLDPKDGLIAPVPLTDVTIAGIAENLSLSDINLEDVLRCETLDQLQGLLGNDYFEVQLHGEIGVEHIAGILVKPGIILPERIRQWAQSQQIPTGLIR